MIAKINIEAAWAAISGGKRVFDCVAEKGRPLVGLYILGCQFIYHIPPECQSLRVHPFLHVAPPSVPNARHGMTDNLMARLIALT